MLPYILALAVAVGSFAIYMAAFFFPEVHRKGDLVWSGVGLFYALVLWFCAGQISGAVLLGQMASVALLAWFGWQALILRRQTTPVIEQTPVSGEQLDRLTGGLTGIFKPKSVPKAQTVPQPQPQITVKAEKPTVAPTPGATIPEVPPVRVTPEPLPTVKPAAKVTTPKPQAPRFADRFSLFFKGKDKDKSKAKLGTKTQPQPPAEVASVAVPELTLVQPPVPVEAPPAEPTLIQPPVPVEAPPAEPTLIQPEPNVIPVELPAELPTEASDQSLEMPAAAALEGATMESEVFGDEDFGFEDDDLQGPGITKADAKAVANSIPVTTPPLDQPAKLTPNKAGAKLATPGGKQPQGPSLLNQIQEGIRGLLNFGKSPKVKPLSPSPKPLETTTQVEPKLAIAEDLKEIADTKPPQETATVVVKTADVIVEVTVEQGEPVEVITFPTLPERQQVEALRTTELEATAPNPLQVQPPEVIQDVGGEIFPEGRLTAKPVEEYALEVELAPAAEVVIPLEDMIIEVIEVSETVAEVEQAQPEELESSVTTSDRLLQRPQRPDPAVAEAPPQSEEAQSQVTPPTEAEPPSENKANPFF